MVQRVFVLRSPPRTDRTPYIRVFCEPHILPASGQRRHQRSAGNEPTRRSRALPHRAG